MMTEGMHLFATKAGAWGFSGEYADWILDAALRNSRSDSWDEDCPMGRTDARPKMPAAAKNEHIQFWEMLLPTGLRGGWLLRRKTVPGEL